MSQTKSSWLAVQPKPPVAAAGPDELLRADPDGHGAPREPQPAPNAGFRGPHGVAMRLGEHRSWIVTSRWARPPDQQRLIFYFSFSFKFFYLNILIKTFPLWFSKTLFLQNIFVQPFFLRIVQFVSKFIFLFSFFFKTFLFLVQFFV